MNQSELEPRDPEIEALLVLVNALAPFDGRTRRRMLEWLVAWAADLPAVALPSMPDDEERDA